MVFGLSAAAVAGIATAVGGVASAVISGQAASKAADAQTNASNAAIAQQQAQFAQLQKLLQPYNDAGLKGLGAENDLLGLNGNDAQTTAINGVKTSSQFDQLNAQGQNAILQNATATGGLRGGNVQGALAQFSPALLNQLINQKLQSYINMAGMGENAAAGVGNAGMSNAQQVSSLLQQSGAAAAGADLAGGKAIQTGISAITGALGNYVGNGGTFGAPATGN